MPYTPPAPASKQQVSTSPRLNKLEPAALDLRSVTPPAAIGHAATPPSQEAAHATAKRKNLEGQVSARHTKTPRVLFANAVDQEPKDDSTHGASAPTMGSRG